VGGTERDGVSDRASDSRHAAATIGIGGGVGAWLRFAPGINWSVMAVQAGGKEGGCRGLWRDVGIALQGIY